MANPTGKNQYSGGGKGGKGGKKGPPKLKLSADRKAAFSAGVAKGSGTGPSASTKKRLAEMRQSSAADKRASSYGTKFRKK